MQHEQAKSKAWFASMPGTTAIMASAITWQACEEGEKDE
jgi:hypothetical protein